MMRLRACVIAAAAVALSAGLQGCLLDRVLDTRAQLCDEEPPKVVIVREAGRGLRIVFKRPTLTDRDVAWIVGHEPAWSAGTPVVREADYEALPRGRPRDRSAALVAKLTFSLSDDQYRLAEVELPENFNAILPPSLLEGAVRVVCQAPVGIIAPGITFDLASLDRSTLPTRAALVPLLGMPMAPLSPDAAEFQYCLAPCAADAPLIADLRFGFVGQGELRHATLRYFRYSVVVDLNPAKPIARVRLN